MNNKAQLNKQYRNIAWGVLFILIGGLSLVPGDQTGLAILATGAILLTLNLVRRLSGIRVSGFTLVLGSAGFVIGAIAVAQVPLGLHLEVEAFPVILIAIGVYFLWPAGKPEDGAR